MFARKKANKSAHSGTNEYHDVSGNKDMPVGKSTINGQILRDQSSTTAATVEIAEEEEPTFKNTEKSTHRNALTNRGIGDSVHVNLRRNKTNDAEEHKKNPHLRLAPHTAVLVEEQNEGKTLHKEVHHFRPFIAVEESDSDSEDEGIGKDKKNTLAPVEEIGVDVEDTDLKAAPIAKSQMKTCLKVEGSAKDKKNKVTFRHIVLRDYSLCIGDNPSVSYGAPISLDWGYLEYEPIDLDEYELNHGERRTLRQLLLSYYRRRDLLATYDITEDQMKLAWKDVKKVKKGLNMTRQFKLNPAVMVAEDAMESMGRKLRRIGGEKTI